MKVRNVAILFLASALLNLAQALVTVKHLRQLFDCGAY